VCTQFILLIYLNKVDHLNFFYNIILYTFNYNFYAGERENSAFVFEKTLLYNVHAYYYNMLIIRFSLFVFETTEK
jgi:hypothetical protein